MTELKSNNNSRVNDDLLEERLTLNLISEDEVLKKEVIEGRECYVIEMIPKEETAVVWGKILHWVDVEDYLELKTEFYDEDDYLVTTILGKNIKEMDGRLLPTKMEVIPEEDEGHMTIVEQVNIKFDVPFKESFFSVQNMKRVR